MSNKNVQIRQRNGAGWDDIFPKTKSDIVIMADGTTTLSAQVTALLTSLGQKATPADITTAIANLVNGSQATLDTLNELALALGNDANFASSMTTSLGLKAPLASPAFTGTVTGITKTMVGLANVDNTTDANKPVSTAQATAIGLKANSASPTFTGTVTVPTPTAGDNTTKSASTAFVKSAIDTATILVPQISTTAPPVGDLWYQEI